MKVLRSESIQDRTINLDFDFALTISLSFCSEQNFFSKLRSFRLFSTVGKIFFIPFERNVFNQKPELSQETSTVIKLEYLFTAT